MDDQGGKDQAAPSDGPSAEFEPRDRIRIGWSMQRSQDSVLADRLVQPLRFGLSGEPLRLPEH